jgi:hypothetical protein
LPKALDMDVYAAVVVLENAQLVDHRSSLLVGGHDNERKGQARACPSRRPPLLVSRRRWLAYGLAVAMAVIRQEDSFAGG